jgi:hypothetical protein
LTCSGSEFSFSETYKSVGQLVDFLGQVIGPTQGLYLYTGQHNTEKSEHTSMPRVGFKPKIPVFEGQKTVRVSDRSVIGNGSRKQFALKILPPNKVNDTDLDRLCFPDEATFHVYVEQSTGSAVMCGEVKSLVRLLNRSVMHRSSVCGEL